MSICLNQHIADSNAKKKNNNNNNNNNIKNLKMHIAEGLWNCLSKKKININIV